MNKTLNLNGFNRLKTLRFCLMAIQKTFILLICVGFASVYANSTYAQTKLNIDVNNVKLEDLFNEIQTKSEFVFFYKDDILDKNKRVSFSLKKATLSKILNRAFAGTNLSYTISDRQVIIKKGIPAENQSSTIKETIKIAPQSSVSGVVSDADGSPLPGANVLVKETTNGTQTDFDGNYTIDANSDAVLVFSYIGFKTQEVSVNGQSSINITLKEDASALEEVVVTGYTRQNTRNISGAVSIVNSEALAATTPSSIEQALQGQSSGVTIGAEGGPGGNTAVRIRGFGTINGNDPLYVIDGVQTGQGLNSLNPDDIASIQILKDAAAASIYGIGAANGVIIITTKTGKKSQKTSFTYNSLVGVDFIPSSVFPNLATPQQLAEAYFTASTNDGITPNHSQYGSGATPVLPDYIFPIGVSGAVDESTYSFPDNRITRANKNGTNLFDEFFNAAFVQQHNIGISGGSDSSKFYLGLGLLNQEGVAVNTSFDRYSIRANSEFDVTRKLRIGETLNISYTEGIGINDPVGSNNNQNNESQIAALYRNHPIIPVYDIEGNFAGTNGISGVGNGSNPIATADRNKENVNKGFRVIAAMYAELDITSDLLFKTTYTADYNTSNFAFFRPIDAESATARSVNLLRETNTTSVNTNWYNILQYTKTLNDVHAIDVFVGTEFKKNNFKNYYGQITDFLFTTPDATYLSAGTGAQTVGGSQNKSSSYSVFGKLDYVYDDKYLLSATIRSDQSSLFEAGNQNATFPAFSAGWRLSNEAFLSSDKINDLLFKVSWGQVGNNAVPAGRAVTSYGPNLQFSDYAGSTGYFLTNIGSPDLSWETTTMTNFGIKGAFLDNKVSIGLDIYKSVTEDMILPVPVDPTVYGNTVNSIYKNIGQMTNKGFDFDIAYSNDSNKEFNYTIGANISKYKNNVDFLDKENPSPIPNPTLGSQTGFETANTVEGYPIASFVGLTWEGIDQTTGRAITTGDARDVIGNPHPDFTYGVKFNADYKGFDFSMLFQGSQGNDIYNLTKFWTDFSNFEGGKSQDYVSNSWSPTNTGATLPALTLAASESTGSSYYIEDGSYLRLKNIVLGYSLNETICSKIGVKKIRMFLQGKNLLTFTDYSGLDPEINLTNYTNQQQANLEIGVDRGAYPISRSLNLGLNVSF